MTVITSKRTIVAVLIVLALVFLYLSYEEGKKIKNPPMEENFQGVVAENAPIDFKKVEGAGDLEINDIDEGDFFIEYRLERDRRRAQEIEMLQSMFNSSNVANEVRQEALQKVLQLTNSLDQELTLETLIVAKGYADAVTFIQQNQVTVVVKDGDFDNKDAAKIADLVNRTTGIPMSKITIFAKK